MTNVSAKDEGAGRLGARTRPDYRARIRFVSEADRVEIDLSGLVFASVAEVFAFYATLDHALAATGRPWYFLVDYRGLRIDSDVWFAWGDRGWRTMKAHGLGVARFAELDAADRAERDPRLYPTRAAAVAALEAERAADLALGPTSTLSRAKAALTARRVAALTAARMAFRDAEDVVELDFTGLAFDTPDEVAALYDAFDERLDKTLRRWWLLVLAEDCRIAPGALAVFARRGRALVEAHGLGAVRVLGAAARPEVDPGTAHDRAEGLARIAALRAEGLRISA